MEFRNVYFLMLAVTALFMAAPIKAELQPLKVSTTTVELASIANSIGGNVVEVTSFAKPTEDPHFVQPKPSFIKQLSESDAFLLTGLELEIGWSTTIVLSSRNQKIQPGSIGYIDASEAIAPLDVPAAGTDRSTGDVHTFGNPHYLLDPICGLRVARLVKLKFSQLRPEAEPTFQANYDQFEKSLSRLLVGDVLAEKYPIEKLMSLNEVDRLKSFLSKQNDLNSLGGLMKAALLLSGSRVVVDHNLWPYFAKRYGLQVVGYLEPKPGIPPTARHLQNLIDNLKPVKVGAILANPYYDPRHANFLAQALGVPVAQMAHQVGSRPNTSDYLELTAYNIQELLRAMRSAGTLSEDK